MPVVYLLPAVSNKLYRVEAFLYQRSCLRLLRLGINSLGEMNADLPTVALFADLDLPEWDVKVEILILLTLRTLGLFPVNQIMRAKFIIFERIF